MKALLPRLLLIVIVALAHTASADLFSIPGSGISFDAPAGFNPLTPQEIAAKYPSSQAPAFVVGNTRRTTTIAYDLKPHAISPEQLAEFKGSMEKMFERIIPGIEWKDRKIIEHQNRKWIYFEMTARAVDTDIYNLMLITPFEGKLLIFNFNSTTGEFPKVEPILRKSLQSITLKNP